jgi:hypothetical protein
MRQQQQLLAEASTDADTDTGTGTGTGSGASTDTRDVWRDDTGIDGTIVKSSTSTSTREAKVIDDDGGWTASCDGNAPAVGVGGEVHKDVHPLARHAVRTRNVSVHQGKVNEGC